METKALKRQMGAAIAMVLVAAIALAASTYAWFVSNNQVKATTASVSAQSNSPFLKIDKTAISEESGTSIKFDTATPATGLYPSQVVNGAEDKKVADTAKPLFQSAYASSADNAAILDGSRYDVGDLKAAVDGSFAIKESFKIGTTDKNAGSFKDLKVASVELSGEGSAAETGLRNAISVLVVCGDNWGVYKVSENGTLVDKYSDNKTSVSGNFEKSAGVLIGSIATNQSVDVDVYVFYDGSAANVKTTNLANLKDCGMTITFSATPVSTDRTDITGGNNFVDTTQQANTVIGTEGGTTGGQGGNDVAGKDGGPTL